MSPTRIPLGWSAGLVAAAIIGGCGTSSPPASPASPASQAAKAAPAPSFVVSREQFERLFPHRNSYYTYDGLVGALGQYPDFATTGDDATRRREASAFLAHVIHETNGLTLVTEADTTTNYCDASQPYGCPAGPLAYFGRGPLQLSWNYNYHAAGDALGLNLLADPALVARDQVVAWKTALWFWNTQTGEATATPHDAMTLGWGFGETIRAINGQIECNGANPAEVQDRVNAYQRITAELGVTPGEALTC
jgi:predicted chitinase